MKRVEKINNLWYLIVVILPFILNGIIALAIMSVLYLAYLKKRDKTKANKIATAFVIALIVTIILQFMSSYLEVLSSRIV